VTCAAGAACAGVGGSGATAGGCSTGVGACAGAGLGGAAITGVADFKTGFGVRGAAGTTCCSVDECVAPLA
jgi:hypothetical protein